MTVVRAPRARRLAVAAVIGAVVFLVGVAGGRVSAGSSGGDGEESGVVGSSPADGGRIGTGGDGSGREPGESPAEGDRGEEGARAAAVAFAAAEGRWLYLGDEAIAASVAAVATPAAAPRLAAEVTASVGLLRDALAASPGPVWWVVRPLAATVEAFTAERARVAVWVVGVLSAPDVAVPQSHWVTVTVELAWTEGGWRVDDVSERPGPTPVLDASDEPWLPEALAEALAGFEPLEAER